MKNQDAFMNALGISPASLSVLNTTAIRTKFRIPLREKILWADVDLGLVPQGIVVTEAGIHFRSLPIIGPCSMEMEDAARVAELDALREFYAHHREHPKKDFVDWMQFNPENYVGDQYKYSAVYCVGPRANRFVQARKRLSRDNNKYRKNWLWDDNRKGLFLWKNKSSQ